MAEEGSASLTAILEQEFSGFSRQVKFGGCDIVVNPSAAQQFALIIHELATNALKYGALSAPAGRVSIEGKIDRLNGGGTFRFVWRETGGPAVTKPTRRGFGSVIVLDSAKHFGQSVELDYAPRGLSYELQVQLNTIEASHGTDGDLDLAFPYVKDGIGHVSLREDGLIFPVIRHGPAAVHGGKKFVDVEGRFPRGFHRRAPFSVSRWSMMSVIM
jgi:hypothetical protein